MTDTPDTADQPATAAHARMSLWMRTKSIPPTMALFFKDRLGKIHQFRLELVDDAKSILLKAWSVRLIVFFGAVEIAYDVTPLFQELVPLRYYVPVRVLAVGLTIYARVTKQQGVEE